MLRAYTQFRVEKAGWGGAEEEVKLNQIRTLHRRKRATASSSPSFPRTTRDEDHVERPRLGLVKGVASLEERIE